VLISKAQIYKVWDAKKTLKGKKNPAIRVIDPKACDARLEANLHIHPWLPQRILAGEYDFPLT
jgi:hypothetical protein